MIYRRALRDLTIETHDFSMDLADIAHLPQRLHKTANLLKQLTDSVGVKLYLADKTNNEIYFCPTGEVDYGIHRVAWRIGILCLYFKQLMMDITKVFSE